MAAGETECIAFEAFTLDLRNRRFFRTGLGEIPLRPKTLELLVYLARNPGRIVPKSELMDAIWWNVAVSDDSLTQCISDIRRELGDSARSLVRTIPRRGYMLAVEPFASVENGALPASPYSSTEYVVPGKPSIAVLPFTNTSGAPEQEIFADGMTDDLIADLSRNLSISVIARHSAFAYKGKFADTGLIARNLKVRFILEGRTHQAGGRVRVSVQLCDALAGRSVWAERFDREQADIFAVQDDIIANVTAVLIGTTGGRQLAVRKRAKDLTAYDRCVRGRALLLSMIGSSDAVREACLLLRQAVTLDPHYSQALRWFAYGLWSLWSHGIDTAEDNRALSLKMARSAVSIDPGDAANHAMLGYLLAFERSWTESDAEFTEAFSMEPDQPDTLVMSAEINAFNGKAEYAIEQIRRALRLNPHPAAWYYWELGLAHYAAQQFQAAVEVLRNEATYRMGSRRILAASLAQLGRLGEARHEAELFLVNNVNFSIRRWCDAAPLRPGHTARFFVDGYRKAGLPE